MYFATSVFDAARGILYPARDRHAALAPIFSLETMFVAAAIAASITFSIEWIPTAHLKAYSNPKANENCCAFHPVRPSAAAILRSPVAHGNAPPILRGSVGPDASRQGQASPREAERSTARLVPGSERPERPLSDEDMFTVPLPQPRPLVRNAQSSPPPLNGIASISTANPPSAASPAFLSFLKNFFGRPLIDAGAVGRTAVYDIQDRVVYLPNGEKLVAHSGFGKWRDDPRYVGEKNRGPTPPNIYRLSLREARFHGVQAIRLNPVSSSNMYGRAGFLAHPYMLGSNGQSNGCVSLQDYHKFLEAFLRGDIDRLIVVSSSGAASARAGANKQYASQETQNGLAY